MVGPNTGLLADSTWRERLDFVYDMMREMSLERDPQRLVQKYGQRMRAILPSDRRISLSRRGLDDPRVRITRFSGWDGEVNPWRDQDRLPVVEGGVLAELLYGDRPRLIDDLDLSPDDPAYEYLAGQRSVMAIPLLDEGVAMNMVVITRSEPHSFDPEQFPQVVWLSNLFGRATHGLVLSQQLREAYEMVDKELRAVADIQRSLLPQQMPSVPGMTFAAEYQTSQHAGGDYFDFFPLDNGKVGILIADVSGHGTPAAVMMAVTHTIAHMYPTRDEPPSKLLEFVNRHLCDRYTDGSGAFVTAFYGIFDPATRKLQFSSAGHNPPRLKHCGTGSVSSLDQVQRFPLGISADAPYADATTTLVPGDQLLLYTDGITEATNAAGEMFGMAGLDRVLHRCRNDADEIIRSVLSALDEFTDGRPADDDRTLLVAKVVG